MTSNPIFSTRELDVIIIAGSMLGLSICGIGIGESMQIGLEKTVLGFSVFSIGSIIFLNAILKRTLAQMELRKNEQE